jgi:hypothetical protein
MFTNRVPTGRCCSSYLLLFCLSSSCVTCTQMLPVSLYCPFLIAPSVFSDIYLRQERTKWRMVTGWRQYRGTGNIWYTRHRTKTIQRHWQHLVHKTQDEDNTERLATFGTQANVASVSVLSSSCVLCTKCCQCLWIVFVLCLAYQMLPVSLATFGTQDTGRRQFRDTGNIWYTRHRTKTIQRQWQHWIVFVLCLVCQMLSVSLNCLLPMSCVPNVASRPVSCVPNVVSASELSSLTYPIAVTSGKTLNSNIQHRVEYWIKTTTHSYVILHKC